ncbi:MAG: hypothetical protein AAGA10_01455 [Bacteroidota bacterium]
MKFLDKIRSNLSKKKYQQIQPLNGEYRRDFLTLDAAQQVGLIFNLTRLPDRDFDQIRTFIKHLEDKGKKLVIIELNFLKKSLPLLEGEYSHIFVGLEQLDWLRYPQEEVIDFVQQLNLDVMLNFDQSNQITSKYLCRIVNAKTRIGVHEAGFEDCYELMVEPQSVDELKHLIEMFDGYLSMVRK